MLADLDPLLIAVFCRRRSPAQATRNARRGLTDGEVVTLAVAQPVMGIASDRQFLRAARRQLGGAVPLLPSQDAS
jgi:hypothetical protein